MATIMERVAALEAKVFGQIQPSEPVVNSDYPPPLPYAWYREPRVPQGHPNTVYMKETGHVLSVPVPHMKENIIGYMTRVSWQAHGDPGVLGSVMTLGPTAVLGPFGYREDLPASWPYATDRFFNEFAYMTPEELAEAHRKMAEWPTGPKS